jgi:hypothetical protein
MSDDSSKEYPLVKRGRGRPKGSHNKNDPAAEAIARSRALLQRDHNIPEWIQVMTPRDVMMHAMAKEAAAERWITAAEIAAKVAPYVHSRLAQIDLKVTDDLANRPVAEIEQEIKELERLVKIQDVGEDGDILPQDEVVIVTRTSPEAPIIDEDGRALN